MKLLELLEWATMFFFFKFYETNNQFANPQRYPRLRIRIPKNVLGPGRPLWFFPCLANPGETAQLKFNQGNPGSAWYIFWKFSESSYALWENENNNNNDNTQLLRFPERTISARIRRGTIDCNRVMKNVLKPGDIYDYSLVLRHLEKQPIKKLIIREERYNNYWKFSWIRIASR